MCHPPHGFGLSGNARATPGRAATPGEPPHPLLVSRAADTYGVGSTEKLGAACSYQVVRLSETAGVITDALGDHTTVSQLRAQGVTVLQA
jgi:hypothetical protein